MTHIPSGTDTFFANQLLGRRLSGVTFVPSYVQLQFDPPPLLNVYTPMVVESDLGKSTFGQPEFANLAIAQIGKTIRSVAISDAVDLRMIFIDGSVISVSLKPDDYRGPDAIVFFGADNRFVVI